MLFVTFQKFTQVPKIGLLTNIKGLNKLFTTYKICEKTIVPKTNRFLNNNNYKYKYFYNKSFLDAKELQRNIFTSCYGQLYSVKGIQENISALHMKKRPLRKKRTIIDDEDTTMPGFWNVKSLSTAEEYDLEGLMDGLIKQDLYVPEKICTSSKCEFYKFEYLFL